MLQQIAGMLRWLRTVWSHSDDQATLAYRRHVRGLIVGWAATAVAMTLLDLYPNEAKLSMYGLLGATNVPWQQSWLAAIELAGPLLMAWHVIGLKRVAKPAVSRR